MIAEYEKTLPKSIDQNDPDWAVFIDKINEIDDYIRNKIEELDLLYDPDRCPPDYLAWLGKLVHAGLEPTDSDVTQRRKIRDAVQTHKLSSTWEFDIKNKVFQITGIIPSLINFRIFAFWVWDTGRVLAAMGWNFSRWDAERRFPLSRIWNAGRKKRIVGRFYIDVNSEVISDDDFDKIEIEVLKSAPVFVKIFIGYTTSNDVWITKKEIY